MIELHPATVLLLVEALAVLGLTVVVWTVLAWLRRRRINAALASMVEMASADAAARGERNAASIGTALGVEGEALDTHVKAVERATRVVLKTVITSWSQRDTEAITALPEALEGLNAQWRELLTATGEATPAAAAEDPDQAAEIERLKAEKKTLEDELAITRDTVTRMLNEYAAMYERGDRKDDSTARRLLNGEKIEALAASAEDGPEPVASTDTEQPAAEAAATPAAPEDASQAAAPAPEASPKASSTPPASSASQAAPPPAAPIDLDINGDEDVTEDDLDALFDAHSVHAKPAEGDKDEGHGDDLLAGLDIDDPFDGMEDQAAATDDESEATPQARRTAASVD